jgi:hypothetical protein
MRRALPRRMPSLRCLVRCPLLVAALAWTALGACIDAPVEPGPSVARLVIVWDPLACGDPHRVVIELEDDDGVMVSRSAPCNIGGLTLDVSHLGSYRGRIYAWALDLPIRSVAPLALTIDQAIVHWTVVTPR